MIGGSGGGLASWQAERERERGDRDVSRAPNPSAIRHTSAISDQLSVPGTGRRSTARCLSMSFIVPFPFPCTTRRHPTRWIGGDADTGAHTVRVSTHVGQRGKIHRHANTVVYSAHTCSIMAECTHLVSCRKWCMCKLMHTCRCHQRMCLS